MENEVPALNEITNLIYQNSRYTIKKITNLLHIPIEHKIIGLFFIYYDSFRCIESKNASVNFKNLAAQKLCECKVEHILAYFTRLF